MKLNFLRFAISALLVIGITAGANAQLDDFTRANSTTVGGGWTELETTAGAQISSNRLLLGSTTAGRDWVYRSTAGIYTTDGISTNTGTITWAFNMRTTRTDPSGFDGSNYGLAFILGSTSNTIAAGSGYAVVLGQSGATDAIRLARFTGGVDANSDFTNIISAGDYGAEYLSVKVTYAPSTNTWSLYVESNGSAFPQADPRNTATQIGSSTVNNTYTATGNDIRYMGPLWNHATGAENAVYDDVYCEIATASSNTIATGTVSPTTYCAGASVTVPFTSVGTFTSGNVYTAQLSDASGSFSSPTSIGTLSSTANSGNVSATIPAGATGTGYRIRVVSSAPVVTGAEFATNITVNALPVITPSTGSYCPGATQAVTVNQPGGSWASLNGSPSGIAQLTYVSPGNYTLSANAVGSATFTFNGPNCSNTATYTVTSPPPTPTTADASTCQGSSTTLTGTGSGTGASYTFWTAASGGSAVTSGTTPPGTVSGNVLTVPTTLGAGTYHYFIQGTVSGCNSATRKDVTVTVNAAPANPGNPVAAANPACTSTTLNTMTPAAGTTNYWQGTSSSGTSTTQSTATTYNVASTNTYYVRAQDNTTLCWSTSGSVAVTVNTAPGTPGTVSQSPTGTVCAGTNYVYTVTNTIGVTYNWSFPTGWTPVGVATGNSVTVTAGTSIGTISVTGTNNCGTSGPRTFTVSGIGTPATFTTQPVSVSACDNSSVVLSGNATGASSYQWEYSGDASDWNMLPSGTYGVTLSNTNTVTIAYPVMNDWYGYYFRLKANSSTCGARYSDTIEIFGNAPTVTVPPTAAAIATYNFGTASSGLPSGWTTYAVPATTGTLWEQANSSNSSGYTGASGNSNIIIGQNAAGAGRRAYVETPAISTVGKANINVIWAVRMTGSFIGDLRLEYSVDNGGQWTDLPYTFVSNTTTTVAWRLENYGIEVQLPANANNISNLKLRWSSILQSSTSNLRIDDIKVSGSDMTSPAANVCGGTTFNLPYTLPDLDADQYSLSVSPAITGFTPVVNATLPATQIPVSIPAGTATGDYTFTLSVKSSTTGCSSVTQSYLVHVTTPTFTTSQSNLTCYGVGVGTVIITPTSGVAPIIYTINNFATTQALGTYGTVAPGSLTVGIEDGNGCRSEVATVTITQPTQIVPTAGNGGPYTAGQTINLTSSATGGTGTLSYAWSGPASYTANTANASRTNAQTSHAGTYTVTVTDANNCSATANTSVTVNPLASGTFTWTGNVSTDWDTPGNWDLNQVPNNCTHNVIIPATPGTPTPSGNFPAIDVLVSVGSVQLGNNSRITLDANLNVCGNWTGAPTTAAVMLGNGSVVLQGSTQQTLSGKTQFNTLRLNNSAGAQIQSGSAFEVFTALELQSGTFAAGNNLLTFRSISTTEIGILDNFSSGFTGTVTGSIKAQRYYASPASQSFGQHFMGSPVDAPAFTQFGASGNPGQIQPMNCWIDSFVAGSPYGSVYEYIEANGDNSCGMKVWTARTSGNTLNGKGYSVYRQGTGTLTVNGAPNLNPVYPVSGLGNSNYSSSASYIQTAPLTSVTINSGWHMVANPYLATLNVTTHAANSGFQAQIQVWEASGPFAGTYRPRMTNSNAAIAPFQAFMVRNANVGSTATYNLYATDRSTASTTFYRQANQSELKITALNTTTGLLDETFVAFNTDATAQFDGDYDANKMQGSNTRHSLYTVLGSDDYSINTLNDVTQTSTVPMSMRPGGDATFKFTVDGINTFDATQYIYLEDKITGQMIDLRQNPEYTFSMTTAEAFDRFVLHFTPAAAFAATDANCDAQGQINITQPGTANWNYTVTDANSATISSGTLNQANPVTVNAATGVYTVTLVDANNYTVARNVQVNGANAADATFTPSATTVEEGADVTLVANQNNNSTYTWDLGNGTTATGSGVTLAYTTPGVYTVELTVTNAGGCTATSTQIITVNAKVEIGIKDVTDGSIKLWSNKNKVYVDFSKLKADNATVGIYNLIGQELSKEQFNGTIYIKEVTQLEAGYVLVRVENSGNITTKKLLITNK